MVSSLITLEAEDDRLLNIIKANLGHKNKSQTIAYLIQKDAENFLKVKPEYLEKLQDLRKKPHLSFKSMKEFDFVIKHGRTPNKQELSKEDSKNKR